MSPSSSSSAASSAPASPVGGHRVHRVALIVLVVAAVVVLVAAVLLRHAAAGASGSACPARAVAVRVGRRVEPGRQREPSPGASDEPSQEPVALSVGLGFIPSVQFAPFYLADQAGYYRDAGLDVTFRHGTDYDVIALVGQGELDVGLADGTSVIPAVSNGHPDQVRGHDLREVPLGRVREGVDRDQRRRADLAGKKLGIPGRFGSSWIMLQALLADADLTPEDVEIVEYPDFGQGAAVTQGAVDAATGFANNEPVQLELTGEEVTILRVDDIVPLPGNGLIVGTSTLETKPTRSPRSSRLPCAPWRRSPTTRRSGSMRRSPPCPELGRPPRRAGGHPRRDDRGLEGPGPGGARVRGHRTRRLGAVDRVPDDARSRAEPGDGRRRHRHRTAAGAGADGPCWAASGRAATTVVVAARGAGRGGGRDAPHLAAAAPPLRGTTTADVVIVGGGYTGLWTALRADRAGARRPGRPPRVRHLRWRSVGAQRRVRHELVGRVPDAHRALRGDGARSASARRWRRPSTRSARWCARTAWTPGTRKPARSPRVPRRPRTVAGCRP